MSYSYITYAQARSQLAAMLGDPTNVYWADAELGLYIQEALRTYGCSALYWRERGSFSTSASTAFYALQTQLPTQIGFTVTDQDLVKLIQYHLLEPATGNSWTGTTQFNLSEVTNALQRRRNQFLVETGMVLSHSTQVLAPPPLGRFTLADTIIDLRRLAFQTIGSTSWTTLWAQDEWSMGAFTAMGWVQNSGTPQVFSIVVSPPLTVQLEPPPIANGTLDLVTQNSGADLDPTTGVILGIPDDFAWVIKFGALADLLGMDGQARDPARSKYCLDRWQEGIALAKLYPSIMQLEINDVVAYTTSLQELDTANPTWQQTMGQPNVGALAGYNLLALGSDGTSSTAGIPDGAYGISADVVRKAPVPTLDGDFLQIGREELDTILRYAEHLAAFKMEGAEFAMTMPHYQGLIRGAALVNSRLRANAQNFNVLTNRAQLEQSRRPRTLEPVGAP